MMSSMAQDVSFAALLLTVVMMSGETALVPALRPVEKIKTRSEFSILVVLL
jgi:hypothetical protein